MKKKYLGFRCDEDTHLTLGILENEKRFREHRNVSQREVLEDVLTALMRREITIDKWQEDKYNACRIVRTGAYLPHKMVEYIHLLSKEMKRSKSSIVRHAIHAYSKRRESER